MLVPRHPFSRRKKIERPTTRLEILGITVDSTLMQPSLPDNKMQEMQSMLLMWQGKKAATKREVQSLARKLQHASKVVRPGRCFVHHIYELMSVNWAQIKGWGKWDVAFSGSPSWTHGMVSCFSGNIEVLLPTYVWSNTSASGGVGHRRTISGSSFNGQNPLSELAIAQKAHSSRHSQVGAEKTLGWKSGAVQQR